MARGTLLLEPGTLWARVTERTAHALACGAQQSLPTEHEFIEQGGVRFIVRTLAGLARKESDNIIQAEQAAQSANPFLPYDDDLFVADISKTHVCLLNKYNVVDHHLLLVTRAYEEQETLLTLQDFEALWACMTEFDGFAFYNGGRIAGASQRHKHLQIVPLPLSPSGPRIPIEPVLAVARMSGPVGTAPNLPFRHGLLRLDLRRTLSPQAAAEALLECYHALLDAMDLKHDDGERSHRQAGPYNLLITRHWLLIVPRLEESFEGIAINALGFAGALLVRSQEQLDTLKQHGPMTALQQVALSGSVARSSNTLKQRDVVMAFLRHHGKILLLRRGSRTGAQHGRWAGVGGYLKDNSPLAQARREIREETGLGEQQTHLVRAGQPLAVPAPEIDTCWVLHTFLFDIDDPDAIQVDLETMETQWIEPGEALMLPTVPALAEALESCLAEPAPE